MDASLHQARQDLERRLDDAPLGWRYWGVFATLTLASVLEFFDFFNVGFIVASIGPKWGLTYAASALMLVSGGIGTILGAFIFGYVADKIGRRLSITVTLVLTGASSLLLAIVPEGNWAAFSLLRFAIGLGMGGAITAQMPYLMELTPTRVRSFLPGFMVAISSVGILIASSSVAVLFEVVGWRGVAAIGGLPILVAIVVILRFPESPRWLVVNGQMDLAVRTVDRFVGPDVAVASRAQPMPAPTDAASGVEARAPSRFGVALITLAWFGMSTAFNGIYLWGPAMLAMALGATIAQAGTMFVAVSLSGLTGKFILAFAPHLVGRRKVAVFAGVGGALFLMLAANAPPASAASLPLLLLALMGAIFFIEGGYANLTPYTAEIFPVANRAKAMGLAQAANGLGKIMGPLSIALIAGIDQKLTAQASIEALPAGFMLLAVCAALPAVAFLINPLETHGRRLALS